MRRLLSLRKALVVLTVCVITLACSSCGKKPNLYPVRGQVFFESEPAAGALVVLHPEGVEGPVASRPSGIVQEDGSFTLHTWPQGDGASPGDYRVAIIWCSEQKKDGTVKQVPNRLPDRYASPWTSNLTARVEEGPTTLPPFNLTR